jgi:hypothetical protein
MIKLLVIILLALPLLSVSPVPAAAPTVYHARISIVQSAQTQACTFETASTKLSAQIEDPIGYPYGVVESFSCTGDGLAVANELAERASAMQAEAATYRAAHPIGGAK